METLKTTQFSNGILMIGFGAVASCTLPLLARQVEMPLNRITVIDERKSSQLEEWEKKGIKFIKSHISKGKKCY